MDDGIIKGIKKNNEKKRKLADNEREIIKKY